MRACSVLTCVLLFACAGLSQIETDLEVFDLRGPVKYIKEQKAGFESRNGKLVRGSLQDWEETRFDIHGYYTDRVSFGYQRPWRNKYDAKGRIVERSEKPDERTVYRYFGDKVETTSEIKGRAVEKRTEWFDANKKPQRSEYQLLDSDADPRMVGAPRGTYRYDANGNLLEHSFFDLDGTPARIRPIPIHKWTYEYDRNSRVTRVKAFRQDGSIISDTTRRYDSRGRVVETVSSIPEARTVFSDFDKHGNWRRSISYTRTADAKGTQIETRSEIHVRHIEYYQR